MIRNVAALSAMLMLLNLTGCGPAAPKTVPASGNLLMDGKPLGLASINMQNDQGTVVTATSDDAGKFAFKTTVGPNTYDGAPAGSYKVGVAKSTNDGKSESDSPPADDPKQMAVRMGGMTNKVKVTYIVPQRYGSPTTSGLTLDIPAGGSDSLTIEVKSK